MLERIQKVLQEALEKIKTISNETELRETEIKYLGRKGEITSLLKSIGKVAPEERKNIGKAVNEAKQTITKELKNRKKQLDEEELQRKLKEDYFDITLPSKPIETIEGTMHPVSIVQEKVESIFERMGFKVLDYYEAESDWYNFEGLNIPSDHPARDMQDTFWLKNGNLLRTHTSPGQLRAMQEFEPPFKAVFPGKVFRYERTDASHEHTFHQVEGLMIDKEISVSHLIGIMETLLGAIFEDDIKVRLRPGYFPFVEPGFELDIRCMACHGEGCQVCKHTGWVELLPCGLVHPNVLKAGGVDPEKWTGWAFGLGLSRLAMMRYQITHITHFMGGDLRFFKQFKEGGVK